MCVLYCQEVADLYFAVQGEMEEMEVSIYALAVLSEIADLSFAIQGMEAGIGVVETEVSLYVRAVLLEVADFTSPSRGRWRRRLVDGMLFSVA
jgi:hypothetical protein